VKWFRMDSDCTTHPTIRRVIRQCGNEGFGALVRLWCFAAQYGRGDPGRCVDSDGDPIPLEDLVDASGLELEKFTKLIKVCIDAKCVDAESWNERVELLFPGMKSRASEYTKKLIRNRANNENFSPSKNEESKHTVQDITRDQKTENDLVLVAEEQADHGKADEVKDLWNRVTHKPIPRCTVLRPKRRALMIKSLERHGIEALQIAFLKVDNSAFLRGGNNKGWKASIDWVLKDDSITKILEGNYDVSVVGNVRSTEADKYDKIERNEDEP